MPFLFCPIGPSKPKKTSLKNNTATNSSNKSNQSTNNNINNNQDQHATSSLLRIVTKEHIAQAEDELSVRPRDLVLHEYTYEKWTFVTSLRTSERGFVPENILSDLRRNSPRRKKLPRSESANHELNDHLDPNDQQSKDLSSKSGDNMIRLGLPHHHHHHHHHIQDDPPASSLLQSLQGSSGKQSFPRFPPDMRLLETPAYNNLKSPNSHFDTHLEPEPFHRQNLGVYLVTHNFVARAENDLSVAPGEYVTLLNRDDKDWFWVKRTHDLVEGFVPARFMCRCEEARSILTKGNSMVTMELSRDFHTYINHPPDKETSTDQHSSSALIAS